MDLFEAIEKRHSYRGDFTDAPVPRADLEKIVTAGMRAATAKNEQVATFLIIDDAELLAQLAAIVDRPTCRTAKAVIAVVADPRPVMAGMSFAVEDCAASVSNMLLAVTALGYATVWLDGILRSEDKAGRITRLLKIPEGKNVRVLLPIGVPVEKLAQKEKLPFHQRAWFNTYGG